MLYLVMLIALALLGLWVKEMIKSRELQLRLHIAQSAAEKALELENALEAKEREKISLEIKYQISEEKFSVLKNAQEALKASFQSLSFEALTKNNAVFLELARSTLEKFQEGAKTELEKKQQAIGELLTPVNETLKKLDTEIRQLEKEHKGGQEALKEQLRSLIENERQLKIETSKLVKALHSPAARGRWGEIQLKRVVELAGMLAYCDFLRTAAGPRRKIPPRSAGTITRWAPSDHRC